MRRDDVMDVANKLGILIVPLIGVGSLINAIESVQDEITSWISGTPAEGLVLRPAVELFDWQGHRIITKIKYKDFPR